MKKAFLKCCAVYLIPFSSPYGSDRVNSNNLVDLAFILLLSLYILDISSASAAFSAYPASFLVV